MENLTDSFKRLTRSPWISPVLVGTFLVFFSSSCAGGFLSATMEKQSTVQVNATEWDPYWSLMFSTAPSPLSAPSPQIRNQESVSPGWWRRPACCWRTTAAGWRQRSTTGGSSRVRLRSFCKVRRTGWPRMSRNLKCVNPFSFFLFPFSLLVPTVCLRVFPTFIFVMLLILCAELSVFKPPLLSSPKEIFVFICSTHSDLLLNQTIFFRLSLLSLIL